MLIAFNWKPAEGPWGGGNQCARMLRNDLEAAGHKVIFKLKRKVERIVLFEPRPFTQVCFGVEDIRRFKEKHPGVRCIHRINECDKRKNTSTVDEMLRSANEHADYTVFISQWLRDYFVERWFPADRPHRAIGNGADSRIFHPRGSAVWDGKEDLRLVTHHWADNWNKGFRVYAELDKMIAGGALKGFSLTVIGRWPQEITWQKTRLLPPTHGAKLADLLREHHLYLTASLWEPCGMHHIEGAQCGLPLVFHEDGGGIVEYGRRYGVSFRDDLPAALEETRDRYQELRKAVLGAELSSEAMCRSYREVILA